MKEHVLRVKRGRKSTVFFIKNKIGFVFAYKAYY